MSNLPTSQKSSSEPALTLKAAGVDLLSVKVQMGIGGILLLLICFYSSGALFKVGFLLDDFLHLDYVNRAFHGDSADFLANFYSNWAGSPIMKSFRPLVSVSLFLDYLIYGTNAWGYHLTNLLLLWGNSLFVALVALELCGMRGNRLAPAALWSALLFAVYPLHLEAGAWIIGRVDLLCTLFYLISVFSYLRFRLVREKYLFVLSLLSFAAAMLSKEMAVTLPLVITAAELLLYPFWNERPAGEYAATYKTRRVTAVMSFWFVLGILATVRFLALGTTIGGYGSTGLAAFKNFFNRESLQQILYPVNLDLLSRTGEWDLKEQLIRLLKLSYALIVGTALWRIFTRSISWRIIAFLACWMIVGLLPTYQIWSVSPNLVGSRLFFLSSAPFVILLTFFALPAIDNVSKKSALLLSLLGSALLFILVSIWSYWYVFDIKAWTGAAECLERFKSRLEDHLTRVANLGRPVLILNLPTDYSGGGILTRGQYLAFILRPPFCSVDRSANVRVLEPPDAASSFDYSAALRQALAENPAAVLIWKDPRGLQSGDLVAWAGDRSGARSRRIVPGPASCKILTIAPGGDLHHLNLGELKALDIVPEGKWSLETEGGRHFQLSSHGLAVRPGAGGLVLMFRSLPLSSLSATQLLLRAKCLSGNCPQLSFLWSVESKSEDAETDLSRAADPRLQTSTQDSMQEFYSCPLVLGAESCSVNLGLNRDWALSSRVGALGLYFPAGDYEVEIESLELGPR